MSVYTDTAADFVAEVAAHPILDRISVNAGAAPGGSVVTVRGSFTPGDSTAYVNCDATAGSLLSMLPMTYPGSVWGTDGATIGGHAGLTGGYFRLSKSGIGKRYATAVAKAARAAGLTLEIAA